MCMCTYSHRENSLDRFAAGASLYKLWWETQKFVVISGHNSADEDGKRFISSKKASCTTEADTGKKEDRQ